MYSALTTAEVSQEAPASTELMTKVKGNFDYLYASFARAQGPQIINGSFELDSDADGQPDNWTCEEYAGGTIALETTDPAHGAKALKFIHPGGASNGGGYADTDYIEISELTVLAIGFIHWATAAGMKNKVQARYFTKAKIELSPGSPVDIYNSTSNPTSETAFIYSFTPPATARYMKVRLIGGYTDTDVAGTAYFDDVRLNGNPVADLSVSEAKLAARAVAQAKLKTSSGEVTTTSTVGEHLTMPGGEYGFWPLFKAGGAGYSVTAQLITALIVGTSYVTNIYMLVSGNTGYCKQRYVTSSGEVFWVFLLKDKSTGAVLASYAAPDHPCFGNGGKPAVTPHPFGNYDPKKHEIVVINPTIEELAAIDRACDVEDEATPDRSRLDVILNDYDHDTDAKGLEWPTEAVTVGLPKGHDWKRAADGTDVTPIKKVIPRPEGVKLAGLVAKKEKNRG
jgi:hypothetical protein